MIRSMTGYGRSDPAGQQGGFFIEIRSVNNRYLDIQVKTPRSLAGLEPRIRKTVQDHFSRGRFDVFITRNGEAERPARLAVNESLASQYIEIVTALKHKFDLSGTVDLSLLAGVPDLITVVDAKEDLETLWQGIAAGMNRAMESLDRMRADEGAALERDITARLGSVERLAAEIRRRSPLTVEHARKRVTDAVARLLAEQPDPQRIAQEIAILAERMDVSEELTRLDSHVRQFRALLGGADDAVGRKLDFLLQELGREANTVASKAMDAEISHLVVEIKAELEKIREQVQNIE